MKLRLPLSGKRHETIVSAYAPTMTKPDEVKDKFCDDLDSVISAAPGQINSSSSGTSMPEWAHTTKPGKDWLDLKV